MGKCLTPYYSKQQNMDFPCGKCFICKRNRASGWSFRLYQELRRSVSAHFLTLTYNNDNAVKCKTGLTLDKKGFQRFMKRLRKLNSEKIKYYAVGEYGGKTRRPHYHAIIFNADPLTYERAWIDPPSGRSLGDIHLGDVNDLTIGYTLKYIQKKKPFHNFRVISESLNFP